MIDSIPVETKMKKAAFELILKRPFFATLYMNLQVEESTNDGVDTMATDSVKLYYNADYVKSLPLRQLIGVIAHEVMHVALGHCFRRKSRDPDLWNIAADHATNLLLAGEEVPVRSRFSLPPDIYKSEEYRNMEVEAIYAILEKKRRNDKKKDGKGQKKGGSGSGGDYGGKQVIGKVIDYSPDPNDPKNNPGVAEQTTKWKRALSRAAEVSRMQGVMPGWLERHIQVYLEPKIPWQSVLSSFFAKIDSSDYSWTMPNKRYIGTGYYLPMVGVPTIGDIAIIIDTSGSVCQDELSMFASEINSILQLYPHCEVTVIYVDTGVRNVEKFTGEVRDLNAKGGGGTNFAPGFEYIDEKALDVACIIYFTDGWCNRYPKYAPEQPTLWMITDDKDLEPPFGVVIRINDE